jgi:DNA-binding response OmpR family regulator
LGYTLRRCARTPQAQISIGLWLRAYESRPSRVEPLIGLDVKATLSGAGCRVFGPVATVVAAMGTLKSHCLDAAVLDINLGKELSFPIADALTRANVPFLFLTAMECAALPDSYRDKIVVPKPFAPWALMKAMARILAA